MCPDTSGGALHRLTSYNILQQQLNKLRNYASVSTMGLAKFYVEEGNEQTNILLFPVSIYM